MSFAFIFWNKTWFLIAKHSVASSVFTFTCYTLWGTEAVSISGIWGL